MAITFVETVQVVMDLVKAKEQAEGELDKAKTYIKTLEHEIDRLEAIRQSDELSHWEAKSAKVVNSVEEGKLD